MFRRRAKERGITVDTFSRGLTIENHISPPLRQKLLKDGIDPTADTPKILSNKDLRHVDVLVAFYPLPPGVKPANIRDWTDMPSFNDDYANARATLDSRIDSLLDEIVKSAR